MDCTEDLSQSTPKNLISGSNSVASDGGDTDSTANSPKHSPCKSSFSKNLMGDQTPPTKKKEGPATQGFHTPSAHSRKLDPFKVNLLSKFAKNTGDKSPIAEVDDEACSPLKKKVDKTKSALMGQLKESAGAVVQANNTDQKETETKQEKDKPLFPERNKVTEENTEGALFDIRKLVFGGGHDAQSLKKHIHLIFRGLNYSINLLKAPPLSYIQSRQILLKDLKKKSTKTLLLDLDETLISSCTARDEPDKILIPDIGEKAPPIMIKIRPFAKEFLKAMKEHYEILVFTAAT